MKMTFKIEQHSKMFQLLVFFENSEIDSLIFSAAVLNTNIIKFNLLE